MGKLNVLGAQRVKALTEILQEKRAQELRDLKLPTETSLIIQVDEEFGFDKKKQAFNKALEKARTLLKDLNESKGENKVLQVESQYGRYELSSESKAYKQRIQELKNEAIELPKRAVADKYKSKEQQLWLCETLEEAKDIVGI